MSPGDYDLIQALTWCTEQLKLVRMVLSWTKTKLMSLFLEERKIKLKVTMNYEVTMKKARFLCSHGLKPECMFSMGFILGSSLKMNPML